VRDALTISSRLLRPHLQAGDNRPIEFIAAFELGRDLVLTDVRAQDDGEMVFAFGTSATYACKPCITSAAVGIGGVLEGDLELFAGVGALDKDSVMV
jgi:hypothetical protein